MFSEACKLCPESPVYLTDRASALMKLGKHREALEDAKKAVAIDQAFTKGFIRIAQCCLVLGNVSYCIFIYNKSITNVILELGTHPLR